MAGFMDPILAQISRQGDIMMYGQQLQRQRQQDEMAQRQQGLQERQTLAQLAAMEQQQALGNKRRQTLADLVKPRQVGGPLAGVDQYQPVGMQRPQFDEAAAYQALMGIGDVEGAMQFQPRASEGFTLGEGQIRYDQSGRPIATGPNSDPLKNLPADYRAYLVSHGLKPNREAYAGYEAAEIARRRAGATNVNVGVGTKGQEAVDKKFAEDYTEFVAGGGFADVMKSIDQLEGASQALSSETGLTGPAVGNVPDFLKPIITPRAVANKEAVEEVVQRNLRLVLGAQFTEKEGERLISRSYNPKLSQSENKKRVDRLIKQIKTAAQSKADAAMYFEKNGTLSGWKGRMFTMNDFLTDSVPTEYRGQKAATTPESTGIKFLGFE